MYNADWMTEEIKQAKRMVDHTEWRIKNMAKELKKAVKSGASQSAVKSHGKWIEELKSEKDSYLLKIERFEGLLAIVDHYNNCK